MKFSYRNLTMCPNLCMFLPKIGISIHVQVLYIFLPARKILAPTCHCCSSVGSNKHLQKAGGLLCKCVSPEGGLWSLDSERIHE